MVGLVILEAAANEDSTYIYLQTKKRKVTENCELKSSHGLSLGEKFVECLPVET